MNALIWVGSDNLQATDWLRFPGYTVLCCLANVTTSRENTN